MTRGSQVTRSFCNDFCTSRVCGVADSGDTDLWTQERLEECGEEFAVISCAWVSICKVFAKYLQSQGEYNCGPDLPGYN